MAKKKERGNGSGTVYPRKNKQGKIIGYRGSYFAPDGKRRYVSAKKKGDAERALRQAMTDADRGLVFEGGTFTVGDYLTRWLTDSVKDTVRSTTFERYEQITRKHIIPEVGRLKLKALTPRTCAVCTRRNSSRGFRHARCNTFTSRSTRRSSRRLWTA